MPGDGQMAFDFDELAREEARERLDEWTGAPLHFTTDYYSTEELDAAFEHWCFLNGRGDSIRRSHMWHRFIWMPEDVVEFDGHQIGVFAANLSPERGAQEPGGMPHLAVCSSCEWHVIGDSESEVVEAWHDHAVPGWRELPVVPAEVRVRDEKGLTALARKWIEVHYPEDMQVPGAPIVTERQPNATRHVAGYSPWGGYDLSSTAVGVSPREDADEVVDRESLDIHMTSQSLRSGSSSRAVGD